MIGGVCYDLGRARAPRAIIDSRLLRRELGTRPNFERCLVPLKYPPADFISREALFSWPVPLSACCFCLLKFMHSDDSFALHALHSDH